MGDAQELNGWGEIATFLRVSVRTAQKYERELGLPVLRLPGSKGRVFAQAAELEAWKRRVGEESATELLEPEETGVPHQGTSSPGDVPGLGQKFGIDEVGNRRFLTEPGRKSESPRIPPSQKSAQRLRGMLVWISTGALGLGALSLAVWVWANRTGPGTGFEISGRTLTVLDDRKRVKWRHEFLDFPAPEEDEEHPKALFSDFSGDGKPATLFLYYPADAKGRHTPNYSAELCYFSDRGQLEWTRAFGTAFRTPKGRSYPALQYTINLLGRLHKPRADGGVIVAGGSHGGTWVYEVEIFTATGKRVGSYVHPGWLYAMAIEDLNGDGVDEIVLGGVNNGFAELGYSATLVVLDSRRIEGQGTTPPGDDRQAEGVRTGTEAAAILLSDFAPRPDEYAFCAVHRIAAGAGIVELKVTQERLDLPFAYYRFDRQLRLTQVQPELNYVAKLVKGLPKPLTNSELQDFLLKRLGGVKVLRNEFDPELRGASGQ